MMSITRSRLATPLANPCTSLGIVFLAVFSSLLIYAAGRGIDPTDESFYLLYYAAPARHLFWVSWFQFVGSLWYGLAGGSVFGLRLWGYATMLACAILCVAGLTREYPNLLIRDSNRALALISICSMYATLFMPAILTPGYNSITACGLALVLGGAGLLRGARTRSMAGSFLVGIGCALVVLGKPSSSPVLLGLLGLWAWGARPGRRPLLLAIPICVAAVLAIMLIHLPISAIWRLVWEPINFIMSFHRVREPMHFAGVAKYLLGFSLIFCSLAALAAVCPKRFAAPGVVALSAVAAFMVGRSNSFGIHALAPGLALGLILLTAVLSRPGLRRFAQSEGPPLELILLSFALPFCYFLGSAVPLTMTFGNASFFWWITVLLCLGRMAPSSWARNLSLFCFISCALWLAIWSWQAFSSPHRHESRIWEETAALTVVPGLERVHVTPAYQSWIQRLRAEAESAGFRPGMPVLDISGGGPGLMLFIEASPAGCDWILGGYRMSTEYLRFALDRISTEDRRRCWVLRLKGDQQFLRFDLEVLREYGIDLERGYEAVWQDTHPHYPNRKVVLLRPVGFGPQK